MTAGPSSPVSDVLDVLAAHETAQDVESVPEERHDYDKIRMSS